MVAPTVPTESGIPVKLLLPCLTTIVLATAACSASTDGEGATDAPADGAAASSYAEFFTATAGAALDAIQATGGDSSDPAALNAAVAFDTARYRFATPSTDDGAWCVETVDADPVRSMTAAAQGDRFGLFFNDAACGDVVPEDSPVALEVADDSALSLTLLQGEDPDLEAAAEAFAAESNAANGVDEGEATSDTPVQETAEAAANAVETYAADVGAYPVDRAEAEAALAEYGVDAAVDYSYDPGTDTYFLCVDDGAAYAIYDSAAGAITDSGAGTC